MRLSYIFDGLQRCVDDGITSVHKNTGIGVNCYPITLCMYSAPLFAHIEGVVGRKGQNFGSKDSTSELT